jgi:hypothetical protein
MAETIMEYLGPYGLDWLAQTVGMRNVLWALGVLLVGLPATVWILVKIGVMMFVRRQAWKARLALDKVIVGLTFADRNEQGDKRLNLRTIEETDAKDVVLTDFAVSLLVRAAFFVSKKFPFLKFANSDDEWVMLNSFLNLNSEKFALGYIAQELGLDVIKKRFLIAITCERGEDIRVRKIRLQLVTENFMNEVMDLLIKGRVFASEHLADFVNSAKSTRQAMERFNDLLEKDSGYKERFGAFALEFGLQYSHHRNRVKVMAVMALGHYVNEERKRLQDEEFTADVLMGLEIALPDTNNTVLRKQVATLESKVDRMSQQMAQMLELLQTGEVRREQVTAPAAPMPDIGRLRDLPFHQKSATPPHFPEGETPGHPPFGS